MFVYWELTACGNAGRDVAMTAMMDDLERTIAASAEVVVAEHDDGTRTVRHLDEEIVAAIAKAVIRWIGQVPYDGYAAENYSAGFYSRRNVAAMIEDIEDDA